MRIRSAMSGSATEMRVRGNVRAQNLGAPHLETEYLIDLLVLHPIHQVRPLNRHAETEQRIGPPGRACQGLATPGTSPPTFLSLAMAIISFLRSGFPSCPSGSYFTSAVPSQRPLNPAAVLGLIWLLDSPRTCCPAGDTVLEPGTVWIDRVVGVPDAAATGFPAYWNTVRRGSLYV